MNAKRIIAVKDATCTVVKRYSVAWKTFRLSRIWTCPLQCRCTALTSWVIAKIRVQIPPRPYFFRLSFCNFISCGNFLCIYFFIPQFHFIKFGYSLFQHSISSNVKHSVLFYPPNHNCDAWNFGNNVIWKMLASRVPLSKGNSTNHGVIQKWPF